MARRLVWGIGWGLAMAFWFGCIASLLFLLADGQGRQRPVSLSTAWRVYLAAGLVGGALIGLLRPALRWWWGAAILGFFIALIAQIIATAAVVGGLRSMSGADFGLVLLYAAVVGPLAGILIYRRFHRDAAHEQRFGKGWYE